MQPSNLLLPSVLSHFASLRAAKSVVRQLAIFAVAAAACPLLVAQSYKVTNIISDGSVPAPTIDAHFLNPWGMSSSGVWWISTADTGFNYVVPSATGTIVFKVIIPSASGSTTATGVPAGSVTTSGASGMILSNGAKASFLFSTLDGTITGWNGKLGINNPVTLMAINNSAAGASYPGLAISNTASGSFILAPNFGKGNAIEVYDNTFKPTKLAGSFTDPTLPAGYAPFGIHILGGQVWVAYALRTSAAPYRTVNTPGNGVVDIFDTKGNFVSRAVTGGNLNAPWGIAFAPANFGIFSNDLLIGNFGNGLINVYDPKSFAYLGQLVDRTGKSLQYASLWELLPGGTPVPGSTSVSGGDTSTVYFTAGLTNEAHGLLAGISNSTAPGTPTFGFSADAGSASVAAGSMVKFILAVVPVNGFNGTVNLACTNLPVGTTCTFVPTSLSVSSIAVTTGSVLIQTSKHLAAVRRRATGIVSAVLLPFASLLVVRRRRPGRSAQTMRLLGLALVFATLAGAALGGLIQGCGTSFSVRTTPSGVSNITINATAGTVMQQTTVALTVK